MTSHLPPLKILFVIDYVPWAWMSGKWEAHMNPTEVLTLLQHPVAPHFHFCWRSKSNIIERRVERPRRLPSRTYSLF